MEVVDEISRNSGPLKTPKWTSLTAGCSQQREEQIKKKKLWLIAAHLYTFQKDIKGLHKIVSREVKCQKTTSDDLSIFGIACMNETLYQSVGHIRKAQTHNTAWKSTI